LGPAGLLPVLLLLRAARPMPPACSHFTAPPPHPTLPRRFWKGGFWKDHLRGRPYHISALYLIDLARFRQLAAGGSPGQRAS
jgi:hypothetical protein